MKKTLTLFFVLSFFFHSSFSAIYRVGDAWGSKKSHTTLQQLIDAGAGKGINDEIWIAGEHTLNAMWTISTWQGKIYGGFSGTENSISERQLVANGRGWEFANPSVLKLKANPGANQSIIASFSYASNGEIVSLIDGIHFDATNCTASPLFLRQFSSSGITIRNCVVENADLPTNNQLNPGTADFEAGGINLGSDDAVNARNIVIEDCLVQNNKARVGGIMARNAHIRGCVIINNIGVEAGKAGGLFLRSGITLENTIFWNNKIGATISNVNTNNQTLIASENIVEALSIHFPGTSGNIAQTENSAIFSPKTITLNKPAEIALTLPTTVKVGSVLNFSFTIPANKTASVTANGKVLTQAVDGQFSLRVMENSVIEIALESIEAYTPQKVTTGHINWEEFLAQHDMYWTSLSADPTSPATDNSIRTGYYAGAIMGNGLLGTNLYKLQDNVYRLNFGRSDVTEARKPYNLYNSARLPIGYFTLSTVGKVNSEKMRLSLYNAITKGTFATDKGQIRFETYVHSNKDITVFETETSGEEIGYVWNFVPQQAISPRQILNKDAPAGYLNSQGKSNPDVEYRMEDGYHLSIQKLVTDNTFTTLARVYVVAWKEEQVGNKRRIIATIAQENSESEAISTAKATLADAFSTTSESLVTTHKNWWNNFYQQAAFLSFPNTRFESFYWAQYYKFASTARPGKPIVDLQGVWPTWDTPWTAIWVNLNLQLTYSWQTKANLGMLTEPLWQSLNNNHENLRRNTSLMATRYGGGNSHGYWSNAAVLPRTATYDLLAPLNPAGDATNQYEVGNLAWTLFYYWQHCVAYGDTEALTTKLFPLLKDAINTFFYIRTGPDASGKYGIPPTASPEYTSGNAGANTNYDLSNLRWGLQTLIDLDTTYNINDPKLAEWQDFLDNLIDYPTDANGYRISSTIGIPSGGTNHRHYSHLFMLYPYHMISWDNAAENALLTTSLSKWNGNQGYSYTGKAAMLAFKNDGDGALSQLNTFFSSYLKPNTLYAETGPVIETPFAAVSTLHELYMQDYRDRIRVFYGIPAAWSEASFINMRAKGAFLVSATRKNSRTNFIQVESEKGGLCRLQTEIPVNNLQVYQLNGDAKNYEIIDAANGIIEVNTTAGEIFQLIDKTMSVELPEPLLHPVSETMSFGVNNGPDIPLSGLTFVEDEIVLTQTDPSYLLEVVGEPVATPLGQLTWTSSNPEIVRVENGLIQALAAGNATIQVANVDGLTATCTVTVTGEKYFFTHYRALPLADAYVHDGSNANNNFGNNTSLVVKKDGSGYNRLAFFQFPISDLEHIQAVGDSAKVEVSFYTDHANTSSSNIKRQFFAVETDWNETAITWNNRPAVSTRLLGEINGSTADVRQTIDISDYVWEKWHTGNSSITLNITQAAIGDGKHDFSYASKEHTNPNFLPYIQLTRDALTSDIKGSVANFLHIYPNITGGNISILSDKELKYKLLDLQGRKLLGGSAYANTQKNIDLSPLMPGLYILQAGEQSVKIIRQSN